MWPYKSHLYKPFPHGNYFFEKIWTNKRNKIMNLVHRKEKGFQLIRKSAGPIYREIWQLYLSLET